MDQRALRCCRSVRVIGAAASKVVSTVTSVTPICTKPVATSTAETPALSPGSRVPDSKLLPLLLADLATDAFFNGVASAWVSSPEGGECLDSLTWGV